MNKPDNRSGQRVMTVFKAARIGAACADDLGLIRNISAEGLMIETRLVLDVDEPVVIEIQSGKPMEGRVRWSKNGMTGIQLSSSIDIAEALRTSGPGDIVDRIRPPRFDRAVEATLQYEGRHWTALTQNISLSGAQIVTQRALLLPRNAHAVLGVEGLGSLGGELRWRRGNNIGIRFEHPLPLRHFQQWLHQFGEHRPPVELPHRVPAPALRSI